MKKNYLSPAVEVLGVNTSWAMCSQDATLTQAQTDPAPGGKPTAPKRIVF